MTIDGSYVEANRERDFFAALLFFIRALGLTLPLWLVAGWSATEAAIFFIVARRILPERVFGSRPTVNASLQAATGPILSRISATSSRSMTSGLWATPDFSTTKPQGCSPLIAS